MQADTVVIGASFVHAMRLIDVDAFLDRELRIRDETLSSVEVLKELDDASTDYAILSHRWGDEVSYEEVIQLTKMDNRDEIRRRSGYLKIMKSCEQAKSDGLNWLWADTCCIDKRSSSELSEAINSMFRWYENSKRCYAYLHDTSVFPTTRDCVSFRGSNGWPEWFSRGWTLQELIAPKDIQFFNRDWKLIGDKGSLASKLQEITRVPVSVLKSGLSSQRLSVAQIVSWAADRRTTRIEDRAYSLMGLLDVNMPMLYGEGKKAFQRLQLEVIRMSNDQSIFAWDPEGKNRQTTSVLADDPSLFRDCHDIVKMVPMEFNEELPSLWKSDEEFLTMPEDQGSLAFTVTNAGIQIWLPLLPYWGCPSLFQAALACRREGSRVPMTIDLASSKSRHYRYFGATARPKPSPELGQLYLAYRAEPRHDFIFKVDDRTIPYYGFSRRDVFPKEVVSTEDTITLSRACPLAVILYANGKPNGYFAVAFGHCFGQDWVHVIADEQGSSPPSDAIGVYDRMWNAGAEYARRMGEARLGTHSGSQREPHRIKHSHLKESIFGVEVVCGKSEKSDHCKVTIDVVKCPGCCQQPLEWELTYRIGDGDTPGLMLPLTYWLINLGHHRLLVDGVAAKFVLSETLQGTQLGDYGDIQQHSHGFMHRRGNIFEDLHLLPLELRLYRDDPDLKPVVHRISGESGAGTDDQDVTSMIGDSGTDPALILRRPIGLSLPNTRAVAILLRALSARSSNYALVTTVICCSACRPTDKFKDNLAKNSWGYSHFWRTYSPVEFPSHSTDSDERSIVPLFQIAHPWAWTRAVQVPDPMTRVEFRKICDYFKTVLELNVGNDAAIDFFMKLFGAEHLGGLVGNIKFFGTLASLSRTSEGDSEKTLEVNASGSSEGQPRAHGLVAMLPDGPRGIDSCSYLCWLSDMQNTVRAMRPIAKTLGFEFIDVITTGFLRAKTLFDGLVDGGENDADDGGISSLVQEVEKLQEEHDRADDDGERRALEEDITGKVLLVCQRGISSEVEQAIAKVVDRLLKDETVDRNVLSERAEDLHNISERFREVLADLPDDRHAHLRRIMVDARARTSKRELYLATRATEESVGRAQQGTVFGLMQTTFVS